MDKGEKKKDIYEIKNTIKKNMTNVTIDFICM